MKIILLILSVFLAASRTHAMVSDTILCSKGKLYIGGKASDRQVYLKEAGQEINVTHFKPWEQIHDILLSTDGTFLLIRHTANSSHSNQLSVLDITSLRIISSIKPGVGGGLYWTTHDNILLMRGCGSDCVCFELYDSKLTKITAKCASWFKEYIDADVIISLPTLYPDNGVFRIWSLKTGILLKEINFTKKYGSYYCDHLNCENGMVNVQLNVEREGQPDTTVTEAFKY